MSEIILHDCRPLLARISERACVMNRKRGLLACEKCAGLSGRGELVESSSAPMLPTDDPIKPRGKSVNYALPVAKREVIRLTFTNDGMRVVRAMQELVAADGSGPLEELLVEAMKMELKKAKVAW